ADGQVLPLVPGITEAQFPVPSLEVVAKLSHLTTEPDVEQRIPVGKLFMSGTGVVSAAKPNSHSHRETASVRKEIWNSRIGDRERIKRIRDWHTDGQATNAYASAWDLEWIRRKWHSCRGSTQKCAA